MWGIPLSPHSAFICRTTSEIDMNEVLESLFRNARQCADAVDELLDDGIEHATDACIHRSSPSISAETGRGGGEEMKKATANRNQVKSLAMLSVLAITHFITSTDHGKIKGVFICS